jgi:ribosomal protein S18 acetylase RimI-like enzyme
MLQSLEERMLNAWPGLQQILYDGWVLRFAQGYTRRANSVNFLYNSTLDVESKIRRCIDIYRQNQLRPVFRITPLAQPAHIDVLLAASGFTLQSTTSVQTLDLLTLPPPAAAGFQFSTEFSSTWLAHFNQLHGTGTPQNAHQAILQSIVPATCFATLTIDRQVVACGLGVLDGERVGLYDIVTAPAQRRKGFGCTLILGILHWAMQNGATQAYLSVEADNNPALALYAKLGFNEVYQYWYQVLE